MTEVESPHYMELAVPVVIAEHLTQVIEEAGLQGPRTCRATVE